jgi:DNA-directed RNA polymerase beta subunit
LEKKIINLENNKIEFSSIISFKEEDTKQSNAINNSYIKYYLLKNNFSSNIEINENDFEFIFSNIIEGSVNICKLKSFTIYAFINNINKPKIYEFNFNFKQMRILYFKSLFNDFYIFLKRLFFIKNDEIFFDYSYFESFYSIPNREIYEFFSKSNQNNQKKKAEENNSTINALILKIREPHIEIFCKDKNNKDTFNVSHFHVELGKELMENLLNAKLNKWMKIIEKNYCLFNANNIIKYEDSKVKKIKRKSLIKGKRKDFQSAFMQFLKLSSSDSNTNKK